MAKGMNELKTTGLGAGFRYSPYGMDYDPGPEYWARVGQEMAIRFPGSTPEVIWVVSVLEGRGTRLTFPGDFNEADITFSEEDSNQAALDLFDDLGFKVWLQVEPGDAPVEKLFRLILARYGKHPCLVGLGVDVEWHHSYDGPEGTPVSDEQAAAWLSSVKDYDQRYRLFLKHWEVNKLPPTIREGILFVDDSQMFDSPEEMLAEFMDWGKHFSPAPVAFQVGYPADKKWWGRMSDSAQEIGMAIIRSIPNVEGIYWVNFSSLEVFPP
jgi:catechol 2,3-dioxygenase-like lactoylglutathione lyase family enzyme